MRVFVEADTDLPTVLFTAALASYGAMTGVLRPVVSAGAPLVTSWPTCRSVRPLHCLFPDERAAARPAAHDRADRAG